MFTKSWGLYASAFSLFLELVDKSDRKQVKKLFTLEKMSLSHGDRFALPRPLTEKEKEAHKRENQWLANLSLSSGPTSDWCL